MDETKTFSFKNGINLKMCQILEQPGAAGIILIGSVPYEGEDRPFFVVHENVENKDELFDELIEVLRKHGVELSNG